MKQWLLATVSIILSTILPAQNITSTFDSSDEMWRIIDYSTLFGTLGNTPPTYRVTGGVTGGCISKYEGSVLSASTLYFVAPPKFLGNKSFAYGNKFSFDIKSERTATTTFSQDNIVFEGGGISLFFNIATPPITWTHIDCPLTEGSWGFGNRNGRAATKAEIQTVLCNISRIWIRCEYITGADEGFLDNVTLEMSPHCNIVKNIDTTICMGQSVRFNGKNYNTTGIFTDTIKNTNFCSILCDSVINLNLKVISAFTTTIDTTICQGNSVKVGNSNYNQSGTYFNTFRSVSGCDSIVTLRLTVSPPLSKLQIFTICQGDNLKVGTKRYSQTGTYIDTFRTALGCDSIVITNLTVVAPIRLPQSFTRCQGDSVKVNGKIYKQTGIFIDTLRYSWGCDSLIITTNLIVNPVSVKTQNLTICQGETIKVGSKTYNQTGVFIDILKNSLNCDSIVTTNLIVNPVSSKSQSFTICQGEIIRVGSKTYNRTGVFMDTLKNSLNCDSIITTNLIVNPVSLKNQSFTICQGETVKVGSKTYNRTGIFTDTLKNFTNCDSIITTDLIVNPVSVKTQNLTICQGNSIKVGSKTYNRTGVFVDTLKNFINCDSIITTNLTVSPPLSISQNLSLCQGDFIRVGSKTYNQTGVFKDTLSTASGCDSIVTTNLTVNPRYDRTQNVAICPAGSFTIGSKTYTQAGTYRDTFRSIQRCDSIITTVLTIQTTATQTQNIALCSGQSLKVGTKTYTQTGVYRDTFRSSSGCDSVVISNLVVNLPTSKTQNLRICQGESVKIGTRAYTQSGIFRDTLKNFTNCDSIITTNLTVIPPLSISQNLSLCQGNFIKIGSKTYTTTGVYKDTLKAISGCDSIVTTNLTVNPVFSRLQSISVCEGGSVKVGSKTYAQTGIFTDTLKTMSGCDSIITTNLTVNQISRKAQSFTICKGSFIKVGAKSYVQTGIFTDTLKNIAGCDSVITTNLTVIAPLSISQNLSLCQGDFIKIGGKTYNQAGVYKDTLRATSGCDSIVTTNLKVNTRYTRTQNAVICPTGSYTINFNTYTRAGTYKDTLFTIDHCDSVVTTVLSIQNYVTHTQNVAFCNGNSIKVGARIYTRTGNYIDTIRAFSGCDSLVFTNLTVNFPTSNTLTATICSGESFKVGAKTYTQSGTYTDILKNFTGCDSTVTTKLTVIAPLSISQNLSLCQGDFIKIGSKTYNKSGIFTDTLKTITGCDSIITTNLTVKPVFSKTQNFSICEGSAVKVGAKTYTKTGIFTDTLKTITGCDSIITTNLGVFAVFIKTQNLELCEGGFVKVGNKTYNKNGIFSDTLKSQTGCDSIVLTILKINPLIARTQTVTLCPNTSLKIGTHSYTQSGTYKDTLRTTFGCDSIITTVLTVKSVAAFTQNISLCTSQSIKVGNKTYNQTGVYLDTLKTITGCDSLVRTNLTVNTVILKTQNLTICQGDYLKVGDRIYLQSGIYTDTLKAIAGCDSLITTNLTVTPLPIQRIDSTICGDKSLVINGKTYSQAGLFKEPIKRTGKCDSVIQISLSKQPLSLKRNDITLCPNDTIIINGRVLSKAGLYKDTIASASGCPQIVESNVQNSRLRVNAGADITIQIGDSTRLAPAIPTGTNVLWKWKADKALSCLNCPNPIAKPLESTTFNVEATDTASNCTVKDDIRVVVTSCASLFMPTSFSPNDDGQNDYFTIFAAGCVRSVKKMQVFNRWGSMVFSKDNFLPNNEQDGWDGTFQGKQLTSNVYTYLIELELGNGKTEKVWGDVTLMR